MSELILVLIVLVFLVVIGLAIRKKIAWIGRRRAQDITPYGFVRKRAVMTARESAFMHSLATAVGDRYVVFPQLHLSALFDHRIKGQNWRGAFATINGKSV